MKNNMEGYLSMEMSIDDLLEDEEEFLLIDLAITVLINRSKELLDVFFRNAPRCSHVLE